MMGRYPWTLFTAMAVVLAVAFTASSGQENESETSKLLVPGTKRPALDLDQKDAMDEILRIRQRHGDLFEGSIFADLNESSKDSTPADQGSDQFAQALKRVMQRKSEVSVTPAAGTSLTERCESAYERATVKSDSQIGEDSPFSRALRRSARLLDRRANDLEDRLMYAEADRLRDLATQLRTEARSTPTARTARTPRSQAGSR